MTSLQDLFNHYRCYDLICKTDTSVRPSAGVRFAILLLLLQMLVQMMQEVMSMFCYGLRIITQNNDVAHLPMQRLSPLFVVTLVAIWSEQKLIMNAEKRREARFSDQSRYFSSLFFSLVSPNDDTDWTGEKREKDVPPLSL